MHSIRSHEVTPERFRELTEIYGAEPQRWPAAEREAALAYMRDQAADADAVLADAATLDGMLSSYTVVHPDAVLRERVIASAPKTRNWSWRPAGLLWRSAGLAGLGLAGALAGALVIGVVMPLDRPGDDDDSAYVVTAFDELS
jgi:anti-sigma factor RsiW